MEFYTELRNYFPNIVSELTSDKEYEDSLSDIFFKFKTTFWIVLGIRRILVKLVMIFRKVNVLGWL
jgi:hypothetical protein